MIIMTKTLNDYATELAMINANFCSTYSPSAIYEFTPEFIRISICNQIRLNDIVKMEQKDIDTLIGFVLDFSDLKMIAYREALIKYSEVLHC